MQKAPVSFGAFCSLWNGTYLSWWQGRPQSIGPCFYLILFGIEDISLPCNDAGWKPTFPVSAGWKPTFPVSAGWNPTFPVSSGWNPTFPVSSGWNPRLCEITF